MSASTTDPLLKVRGIGKAFPGVKALDGVDLAVGRGEIHALLGENGAGKSTLLKILAGAQAPDTGTMQLDGALLDPADTPLARQQAGIVTIYQEFNLLPEMSVAENMYLGREPLRYGFVDHRAMEREATRFLASLDLNIDAGTPVRRLTVAEQQMVEIARAMTFDARLIIMDEPTAALSEREVDALHRIARDLRDRGISIIYVTHRLGEVAELCDRFTVLRDGRFVATGDVSDHAIPELVRLMVGRNVEFVRRERKAEYGKVLLAVEGVSWKRGGAIGTSGLSNVTMGVRAGEILGLAGLVGAGRTDLVRIIYGAETADCGVLRLGGGQIELLRSPAEGIRHGIALVPEDRKRDGCFLDQSIRQNMALPSLRTLAWLGIFVDDRAEARLVEKYRKVLRIAMASDQTPIGKLSGGNQQKVLLARCMALSPRVLIVDEPTRGIDIGAKSEVHDLIRELADTGVAVIVVSSELPEVLAISDRIAVFREGCLVGELDGETASEEATMALMATGTAAA